MKLKNYLDDIYRSNCKIPTWIFLWSKSIFVKISNGIRRINQEDRFIHNRYDNDRRNESFATNNVNTPYIHICMYEGIIIELHLISHRCNVGDNVSFEQPFSHGNAITTRM